MLPAGDGGDHGLPGYRHGWLSGVVRCLQAPAAACGPSCSGPLPSRVGTGRKRHVSSAHAGLRFARGVMRPFCLCW
jgi:hypothetical protein